MTMLAVLESWRCSECGRKLARLHVIQGAVQIQCRNCATMNLLVEGELVVDKTATANIR